jgi:2-polyprenyl-3-methyl-5-hydroxy-6-metoxy-1,4-benzoquinol methylase
VANLIFVSGYQRSGTIAFGQALGRTLRCAVLPEVFLDREASHESFFSFWTHAIRSGESDAFPEYERLHELLQRYFDRMIAAHGENLVFHIKADQYGYVPFLREHLRTLGVKFICIFRRDNLARMISCWVADKRFLHGFPAHDLLSKKYSLGLKTSLPTEDFARAVSVNTRAVLSFVNGHRDAGDEVICYEDFFESKDMESELQRLSRQYSCDTQAIADLDEAVVRSMERPEEVVSNFDSIAARLSQLGQSARYVGVTKNTAQILHGAARDERPQYSESSQALIMRLQTNGLLDSEIGMDLEAAARITDELRRNYYCDAGDFNQDNVADLAANLYGRQASFEKYLVPWVERVLPLRNARIADVGCGTGSSTAALAKRAARVVGYEIADGPAEVARERLGALSLFNASVRLVSADTIIRRIQDDFPQGVDVISLIAVLEHMTYQERLEFLPNAWSLLTPGGIMIVAETPNRLSYLDEHTSQLPFFQMLPVPIGKLYSSHSPRILFKDSMKAVSNEDAETALNRWGLGLSYHDFEIAFGVDRLETIILADGYESEPISWFPVALEERILAQYFTSKPIEKPMGFCRSVLNFIFVKMPENSNRPLLNHSPEYIRGIGAWNNFSDEHIERLLRSGTI